MARTVDRRTILAAGLAAAAPVPGVAATNEPDPIHAAIERHRLAHLAFVAADCAKPMYNDSFYRAGERLWDALDVLLATTATTLIGVAALVRHFLDLTESKCGTYPDWPEVHQVLEVVERSCAKMATLAI